MSVINQVLVELEKRRASGAERGALPDHVRALPDSGDDARSWRFAVAGATAVVVLGLAWMAAGRLGWRDAAPPSGAALPPPVAEAAIETMVSASAVAAVAGSRGDAGSADGAAGTPASRLTFELARIPAAPRAVEAPEPVRAQPIAAARVLERADLDPAPAREAPAAPAAPAAVSAETAKAAAPAAAQAEKAKPAAARAVEKHAAVAGDKGEIEKQVRQPTPRELADQEYRKAAGLLHQGRLAEAQEAFRATLNLNPAHHAARQALVALLLQGKAHGEAERLLQDGVKLAPEQIGLAMTLARLQVDRGDGAGAVATLQGSAGHAQASPDYLAFLAALLQRQGRHDEAIQHFGAALRGKPNTGVWWLGLAMSLQALNRTPEAQDAYRRAKAGNLNAELAAFADQRLRQLQ